MTSPVRVRFAPSPTGYLHIGGVRTALYNWLFARQHNGVYILRMEDTDHERNTDAARATIFRGLDWLDLTPDEGPEQGGAFGPYSQSERQDLYVEWGQKLIESGAVYPCFCTRERLAEVREEQERTKQSFRYDGSCRELTQEETERYRAEGIEPTWRLRVPAGRSLEIDDLVRGKVVVQTKDVEDIILVRSNGVPVYNFAVVVDDHLMEITHVIRGEDHLTNTFKQVLIYEAFGWDMPTFAHLPLILGPTGQGKLSKRKHPEAALEIYQDRGYPKEAFVNWLAMVGWSLDDKTEILSRGQLLEHFAFDGVNASGARLPMDKLEWLSGEYLRAMSDGDVAEGLRPVLQAAGRLSNPATAADEARLRRIVVAGKERLRSFVEVNDMFAWVFDGGFDYEPKAAKNLRKEGAVAILESYRDALPSDEFGEPSDLEASARKFCEEQGIGFGKLVHPVRAAITGRTQGPGLFDCLVLVGAEECRRRFGRAIAFATSAAEQPES